MGCDKFSVPWCQEIGLIEVNGWGRGGVSAVLRIDVSGAKRSDRRRSETRENMDIGKLGEGKEERKCNV